MPTSCELILKDALWLKPGDIITVRPQSKVGRRALHSAWPAVMKIMARWIYSHWNWPTWPSAAELIRVVALLRMSWLLAASICGEFTGRIFGAINSVLPDVLAAVAGKDYDERRHRQAQGQAKANAAGLYNGGVEDVARNRGTDSVIAAGQSRTSIRAASGRRRARIAKIAKRAKLAA